MPNRYDNVPRFHLSPPTITAYKPLEAMAKTSPNSNTYDFRPCSSTISAINNNAGIVFTLDEQSCWVITQYHIGNSFIAETTNTLFRRIGKLALFPMDIFLPSSTDTEVYGHQLLTRRKLRKERKLQLRNTFIITTFTFGVM